MDKTAVLKATSLFEHISQKSLHALAEICLLKNIRKKEWLFMEGYDGHSLFLLIEGHIQLLHTTPEGQEVVIKMVKPGELFAEAILFEENTYPVSALALERCSLFMIPRHQFMCLLQHEDFRNDFLANLMKKMRFLVRQIRYLSVSSIEERFFSFLEEMHGRSGRIVCRISKKDVAAAISTTPESLSRLLARLKKERKCSWDGYEITVSPEIWKNRDAAD